MSLLKAIGDLSLRKRLYTLMVLLILIPMLITGLITDIVYINRFERQERNVALNVLMQSRNTIDYVLGEVEDISLALLYDEHIQDLYRALVLKKSDANINVLRHNVTQSVSALVFNRPYIDAVLVSRGDEKLFSYGEAVTKEDPELYKMAENGLGRAIWTSARQLSNTVRINKQYYISMLRAVSDLNRYGRIIGVCRISFEETVIGDILRQLNSFSGSVLTIVDSAGDVVSSTEKTLLGTNKKQDDVYVSICQDGRDSGYILSDKGAYTHLYYRLEEPDWVVVQTIDSWHFRSQFLSAVFIMISSILLCMLFAVAYSVVINKTVTYPVRLMYQAMEQVRMGDLDISIPYTTGDELGQLSQQFVQMAGELKNLIQTKYEQQILLKEEELRNLESQINPHFLYNTLDTIRWLALKNDDKEVCVQIEALSDLFRHVLNNGDEMTTIGQELVHLENYLILQKARYGEKIQVKKEVDHSLLWVPVPKLLIQPLVENAIYHGIEHKVGTGTISLFVSQKGQDLSVVVEDDGVGTQGEIIRQSILEKSEGHLFALRNIHDRIQLRYGSEYGEMFESWPGKGTRVELRLPIRNE